MKAQPVPQGPHLLAGTVPQEAHYPRPVFHRGLGVAPLPIDEGEIGDFEEQRNVALPKRQLNPPFLDVLSEVSRT